MKIKILLFAISLMMTTSIYSQFEQEVKNVAIFVHEGVELFDFAGPGEVFVAAGRQSPVIDFNVYTVAATEDMVTSQTFLKIIPNYSIDNCPAPQVIVLPGGATNIPLRDPKVIEWIKRVNESTDITLSVCTGAFLLGKAGLLEGLKATTHWGSIQGLKNNYPNTEVLEETKFVDNGKIVTSGGVSSGTEGSLHVVSRLAGKPTAQRVARYMEYNNWDDRIGLVEKESEFISAVKDHGFETALSHSESDNIFYGELYNLATEYLENNETAKALPILDYLSKKYPVSETYEQLGNAYKKMGRSTPLAESEIVELINSREIEKVLEQYEKDRKEFPGWIIFNEITINSLGYKLMNQDRIKDAIQVFTLNTREFPDSFNVWDSLAESYLKSGNKELARKYYEKSLKINPDNSNAKEVLSSME